MRFKSTLVAAVLMLASIGSAQAVPVKVDFTATGFGGGAPQSSVAGTFVYDAVSLHSNIVNSLTSIDLTVAGHTYTLGEVGFISPFGSNIIFGGNLCAVNCMSSSTHDFWFYWNPASLTGMNFSYSTVGSGSFYSSSSFTEFTQTTGVPEPMSLGLLGAGLLAMWSLRRRRSV